VKVSNIISLLEDIQKRDKQFQYEKSLHTAATFCCECGKNTFVGLKPFWHRFGRELCDSCAKDYVQMLKALGAYDETL